MHEAGSSHEACMQHRRTRTALSVGPADEKRRGQPFHAATENHQLTTHTVAANSIKWVTWTAASQTRRRVFSASKSQSIKYDRELRGPPLQEGEAKGHCCRRRNRKLQAGDQHRQRSFACEPRLPVSRVAPQQQANTAPTAGRATTVATAPRVDTHTHTHSAAA